MPSLRVLRELSFEPLNFDAQRERARVEQAREGFFQFTLDRSVLEIESDKAHVAPALRRNCCCFHVPPLPVSVRKELWQPDGVDGIGRRAHGSFNELNIAA